MVICVGSKGCRVFIGRIVVEQSLVNCVIIVSQSVYGDRSIRLG